MTYVKQYEQFYLDTILDKISKSGIDSLNGIEKNYLDRISKGTLGDHDQDLKKGNDVSLDVPTLMKGFDEYMAKQWERDTIELPSGHTVKLFDDVMVIDEETGDTWEGSVIEIHDDHLVVKDDGEFKNKVPLNLIKTWDEY